MFVVRAPLGVRARSGCCRPCVYIDAVIANYVMACRAVCAGVTVVVKWEGSVQRFPPDPTRVEDREEAKAPEAVPADSVQLNFRKLNGDVVSLQCGMDEPFGNVKLRLQREVGVAAVLMRLVCRGASLDDASTPSSTGIAGETLVHVVVVSVRVCGWD